MSAILDPVYTASRQQLDLWDAYGDGIAMPWVCSYTLQSGVDENVVCSALVDIVNRSEVLRTQLYVPETMLHPVQKVRSAGCVDWHVATNDGERNILQLASEFGWLQRSFWNSGTVGALFLRQPMPELILVISPFCADRASLFVLAEELSAIIDQRPHLRVPSYLEYCAWQASLTNPRPVKASAEDRTAQNGFEAIYPVLPWGAGRERPADDCKTTVSVGESLRTLASARGTSVEVVALAIWAIVAGQYGGCDRFKIDVVDGYRDEDDFRQIVGPLVQRLPVAFDFSCGGTFLDVVRWAEGGIRQARDSREFLPNAQPAAGLPIGFSCLRLSNPCTSVGVMEVCGGPEPRGIDVLLESSSTEDRLAVEGAACEGPAHARRFLDAFARVLSQVGDRPETDLNRLDAMSLEDCTWLSEVSSGGKYEIPLEPLTRLISDRCMREPHSVAIREGTTRITYEELEERSTGIANILRTYGASVDSRVAIAMPRSAALIVTLLGILKSGAAYVPIDPSFPLKMAQHMIDDSCATILICDDAHDLRAPQRLALANLSGHMAADVTLPAIEGQSLAYIIYTSGSTGYPKGVMIPHDALSNYLQWCASAYATGPMNALLHSSVAFDLSVTSLFLPLLSGGAVTVLGAEDNIADLGLAIKSQTNQMLKLTPSHLALLQKSGQVDAINDHVGTLVVGGEALRPHHLRWKRQMGVGPSVFNEYGPTEATVGCSVAKVALPHSENTMPIGVPIRGCDLFVLDEQLCKVPPGKVGELYIGGQCLARGYVSNPSMTAACFVPNPFDADGGERLYKTGDLVRHLRNGSLEFIGRADNQLKVSGTRVDPEGIVALLCTHPQIIDATVIGRNDDEERITLVAYVVPAAESVNLHDVRNFLRQRVPSAFIPSAFVELSSLPLTPNGKVDVRALPDSRTQSHRVKGESTQTEVERTIATIWSTLLNVATVDVDANFFELGGNSFLLIEAQRQINAALHVDLSPVELFRYPTIRGLSQRIEQPPTVSAHEEVAAGRSSAKLRRRLAANLLHGTPKKNL